MDRTPKRMGGIASSSSEHGRDMICPAIGACAKVPPAEHSSGYSEGGSGAALVGGGGWSSDPDRNCVSSSPGRGKGGKGGLWSEEK